MSDNNHSQDNVLDAEYEECRNARRIATTNEMFEQLQSQFRTSESYTILVDLSGNHIGKWMPEKELEQAVREFAEDVLEVAKATRKANP
jgi:hypothetical protein